jgi:hypothetical protein
LRGISGLNFLRLQIAIVQPIQWNPVCFTRKKLSSSIGLGSMLKDSKHTKSKLNRKDHHFAEMIPKLPAVSSD